MKHLSRQFFKRYGRLRPNAASASRNSAGMVLFLAISLLALFSVLGASYMRYMSLELKESDSRIRDMRIRHYATAGINSATGSIRAALTENETPEECYTFSYAVYGQTQEEDDGTPQSLSTYTAEAQVNVEIIEKKVWESRFVNGTPWPGTGRAFRMVSRAVLERALPGRIVPVAHQSVEAFLLFGEQDLVLVSMNTMNNYESSTHQE